MNVNSLPVLDNAADMPLAQRFEQVAAVFGSRLAVQSAVSQCSYEELNRRANRFAHALLARGVAPGGRVALLMQHDQAQIVAMIAILKAAGIVVVLNTTETADRLREIMVDAEPVLLVADAAHRNLASGIANCTIVPYDDAVQDDRDDNPGPAVSASDTAFLVYTSGSTGRPRGVMRTHRQELRNALTHARAWTLTADDRVSLLLPLSGGVATTIAWAALSTGAMIQPFDVAKKGVVSLAGELAERRTTIFCSTASFFRSFVKVLPETARFPDIRVLRLGTEAAMPGDFDAFRRLCPPSSIFIQTFGSSETGNIAQLKLGHDDVVAEGKLPVGDILNDIEVRLVDDDGRDVAHGEAGEIVVRSRFMAAGYWRDDALTAAKFSDERGTPVFRIGDIGRLNAAGQLELVGRRDDMVKIRGYRVTLSEVEEAVLSVPTVSSAAVTVTKGANPQLIAYVSPREGVALQPASLRRALLGKLPGFMMPSHVVLLAELPLGPNGKVDRAALNALPLPHQTGIEKPTTPTEETLAKIWAEAFDQVTVGRNADFFDLGGDSLTAAVIGAHVHAVLGTELGFQAFVDFPTLAELASHIDEADRDPEAVPGPQPAARDRPLPLSLLQERVWKYSQTPEQSAANTQSQVFRIRGRLDRDIFHKSVVEITRRHEMLRTSIAVVEGQAAQIVHSDVAVELPYVDLAGHRAAEDEALRLCRQEESRPFDLAKPPLYRLMLIRLDDDEHLLLRRMHQLIKDKWSNRIFFRELSLLYEAALQGAPPPTLEPVPLQYGDYAVWQRQVMNSGAPMYQRALTWWSEVLADAPALNLDHLRHHGDVEVAPTSATIRWRVSAETSDRLHALGKAQHATYFAVRQAALAAFLAAETRNVNVVMGSYVDIRKRFSLRNTFGPFLNLATLRYRLEPDRSFREWVTVVRDQLAATDRHTDLPYEHLSAELARRGIEAPEIRLIFNVTDIQPRRMANLTVENVLFLPRGMPWGLTLAMDEYNEIERCLARFDGRIYDPELVGAFVQRFVALMDKVAGQPDVPLSALLESDFSNAPSQKTGTHWWKRLFGGLASGG